jgi:hypothetical protein
MQEIGVENAIDDVPPTIPCGIGELEPPPPPPPPPTTTEYGEGADTVVDPYFTNPPPPPPPTHPPPPPPPATTRYSTVSPKVPGAVTVKVPDDVNTWAL